MRIIRELTVREKQSIARRARWKCANFYETEVDNAVDGLTALMEPMIMAGLGVLVGGLMIAMYMPIFQIGSVI